MVDDVHQSRRQIACRGGCAHLVKHHLYFGTTVEQTEDGLGEILAMRAVQPSGAHNDVLASRGNDGVFAQKLRTALDASGRSLLTLGARRVVRLSSKHIVCGDVHQPRISFGRCLSHVRHCLMVERIG